MTTEIAVMNKTAVALAADSAVTIPFINQQGYKNKIFNSANKLFALSKRAPVGVMVYGSATLMGIPWETLIKLFRSELGGKKYGNIEEYIESFFFFLENYSFPAELEETYVEEISRGILGNIRRSLDAFDLTPVYVPHAIREFSVFPIVYC